MRVTSQRVARNQNSKNNNSYRQCWSKPNSNWLGRLWLQWWQPSLRLRTNQHVLCQNYQGRTIPCWTTANWIRKNTFKKIMQFQTKHNLGMNILKANSISQTGNGTVKPKWQIQLSLQFDCKSIKDTVTLCVLPNEEVNLLGQEYMMKNNASLVYN